MRGVVRPFFRVVSVLLCGSLGIPGPTFAQQLAALYRIQTVAGAGTVGDGGAALNAYILGPAGLEEDQFGAIYVADADGSRIRKIALDGQISTVVGTGVSVVGGADGLLGPNTHIASPVGLVLDRANATLYFSDFGDCRIRRVPTGGGPVVTLLGTGICETTADGVANNRTRMASPFGITMDANGRLVYAERGSHRVRRLAGSTVATLAGTGKAGFFGDGRPAKEAELLFPSSVVYDGRGNLYIADTGNCVIRLVAPDGLISTFAGTRECSVTPENIGDFGPARNAAVGQVTDLKWDRAYNRLIFTSRSGHVRSIALDTGLIRTLAGNGSRGFSDATRPDLRPLNDPMGVLPTSRFGFVFTEATGFRVLGLLDQITVLGGKLPTSDVGLPPLEAALLRPAAAAMDHANRVLVVDRTASRIRRLDGPNAITTIVGAPSPSCCVSGDGGPAINAQLNGPSRAVRDKAGNLYVSDTLNSRVRKVDTAGTITTLFTSPGNFPYGLAVDAEGRQLYWSDTFRHRVYRHEVASGANTPFAGTGVAGVARDGVAAGQAELAYPRDVALDSNGNLYIADWGSGRVRKVDARGVISTAAGGGTAAPATALMPAASVNIGLPEGLAFDLDDNLLIVAGNRILAYTPQDAMVRLIAGTGEVGFGGDGGFATQAKLAGPQGLGISTDGTVYFADAMNDRIRALIPIRSSAMLIVSGNNQEGETGRPLPVQLTVQVVADSTPIRDIAVSFNVTSGWATVTPTRAVTNSAGNASTTVTLGNIAGNVVVTAAAAGIAAAVFNLRSTSPSGGGGGGGGGTTPPAGIPRVSAVLTAGNFGGYAEMAAGSWLEIYGSNFSTLAREWTQSDFSGIQAPTRLEGVRATFNDRSGFIRYVSPAQVNVQVPDGLAPGEVTVKVLNGSGTSESFRVTLAARSPGLLAPPAFKSGDRQYAAALFADGVTFVGPEGLVPGVPFRAAEAGDRILAFGVGFGATTPTIPTGQVVGRTANLPNVRVTLGGVPVTVEYAGLAPGVVGLYQFNLLMPEGVTGDQPLEMTVDGVTVRQRLYLSAK